MLVLLSLIPIHGMAQHTISGNVTDANDGSPLPGVNVVESGTTNGTITDIDGNYTLTVSDQNTNLIFSFIGYTTQEIAIDGKISINISLSPDVFGIDEVVAIGYGTQKKSDLTGSIFNCGYRRNGKSCHK